MKKTQKNKITDNDITYYYEKSTPVIKILRTIKDIFIPLGIVLIAISISSGFSYFTYIANGIYKILTGSNIESYYFNDTFKAVTIIIAFLLSIMLIYTYSAKNILYFKDKIFYTIKKQNLCVRYIPCIYIILTGLLFAVLNVCNCSIIQNNNFKCSIILQILIEIILLPLLTTIINITVFHFLKKVTNNFWILFIIPGLINILLVIGENILFSVILSIMQLLLSFNYVRNQSAIYNLIMMAGICGTLLFANNISILLTIMLLFTVYAFVKIKAEYRKRTITNGEN